MDIRANLILNAEQFKAAASAAGKSVDDLNKKLVNAGKGSNQELKKATDLEIKSAKAAEARLKVEKNIADMKRRGYGAGKAVGAEQTVMNLMGFDYAKSQRKFDLDKKAMALAKKDAEQTARYAHMRAMVSGDFEQSMSRTRYALYDVGNRALAMGTAIYTAMGISIMQAARFESAFTSVERTVGLVRDAEGKLTDQGEKLRKSLIDLSLTTPVSFEDIAKVATLGAQMGIAESAITQFTKTVSQFSAITGVSVEETSQAFGRLGQMMDVPASKFENLSSAITFVGVNAVATDKEILVMSESIAAASNQAGFAADEVIGLAAALASLKVRPEEARGVIVRLFREIDSSVSIGGARLDDFAKVLNMTSYEAGNLWKNDPSRFFNSFLEGANRAGDLNKTITALGITNSRELNVIQRLANNTDVLASTMEDAHKQYMLATYSAEAYAKVQDDLASKLTIFQNALLATSAALGDAMAPGLKILLDIITPIINAIGNMNGPMKLLLALATALIGGFALFKATMFLAVAGLLAVKTAMNGLKDASIGSLASMTTLRVMMRQVGLTGASTRAGLAGLTGGLVAVGEAGKKAALGLTIMQRALGIVGIITTALVIMSQIGDTMANTGSEAKAMGDAMIEAGGGSEELAKAMAKDTDAAIAGEGAFTTFTTKIKDLNEENTKAEIKALATAEGVKALSDSFLEAKSGVDEMIDASSVQADSNAAVQKSINESKASIDEQTISLGRNTAAFTANALAKYKGAGGDQATIYESLAEASASDKALIESFGIDVATLITKGIESEGGATAYLKNFEDQMSGLQKRIMLMGGIEASNIAIIKEYGKEVGWTAEQIKLVLASQKENNYIMSSTPKAAKEAAKAIDAMRESSKKLAATRKIEADVMRATGAAEEQIDEQVYGLSETLKGYVDEIGNTTSAQTKLLSSFTTLSSGLKTGTDNFDKFSEAGRKNLENWNSYMVASLESAKQSGEGFMGGVERMADALAALEVKGIETGQAFGQFKDYLSKAVLDEDVQGINNLSSALDKASNPEELRASVDAWVAGIGKGKTVLNQAELAAKRYGVSLQNSLRGGAYAAQFLGQWVTDNTKKMDKQKKVMRTLTDYADDLGKAFTNMLKFKFERQNAFGELQGVIEGINDGIRDARKNVTDLQNTLDENSRKRKDLELDYRLAIQFGDTESAKKIANEMASLDQEIAKNQEDVTYNTDLLSGSLDANTQAGRDNDKALQEILTSNAAYIQALVDSGAKQEVVNQAIKDGEAQFRAQATAMNISQEAIDKYAKSFDGFKTIVAGTPKKVNVDASTDPAKRALNQLLEEINNSNASVNVDIKAPTKEDRKNALTKEANRIGALEKNATGSQKSYWMNQRLSIEGALRSGDYAQGGLIRGAGSGTSDSITIGASNGEYMMRASSVNRYGVDFMNALNQQRLSPGMLGGGSSGGSGGVVYLSSKDRELLQAAINRPVTLRTTNRTIAESANDGNRELARLGKN